MTKKILFVGDEVVVYLGGGAEPFQGIILEVNRVVDKDVWYRIRPMGEGVAQGRAFWHRELYVKKETENDRSKVE